MQRVTAQAASAAAVAAVAAALTAGLALNAIAQTTPAAIAADVRTNDIQQLVATLNDPAIDVKVRDEAARRLASRNSAEAKQQLLAALTNAGNSKSQLAVARALAGQNSPDPKYIDTLFGLLGPDRALSDAAGQALSSYKSNPAVMNRLVELSQNAQVHQSVRQAAASALGSFPDKRVAKVLIDLIGDNSGAIRNAAADALVAMTGLSENARDSARWQRWWGTQASKSDAGFRDELLVQRSARLDDAIVRQQQMADEMQAILTKVYRATADATAKDALLQEWLSSSEPTVRLIAARFIVEDFQNGRLIGPPVKDGLRALVGDSSPAVRLQATRSIGTLTDTASFNVLLSQLSQEPLPEVRAAIVTVLGSWEDTRAVPEIVKLLDDESMMVAEASAEALTKLGPRLRGVEPVAGLELAKKLRQVYGDRGNAPGAERLRESLVEAMGPLRDPDPESLRLFMSLLKPRESERMRSAALRGIAALKDPNAADVVHQWLQAETVSKVKVDAIIALSASSKSEHLQTFFDYMTNERESPEVRAQAWTEFKSLLNDADIQQLNSWAVLFQPYPERRVIVLKALAEKFVAAKKLNDLAITQQNIGETLTQIKGSEEQVVTYAAEAADCFKQSLDYFRGIGAPQIVTEKLIRQQLDALLAARKYPEAAKFAGDLMAVDTEQRQLGGKFRVEAERLRDLKKYALALSLIEEAAKIKALTNTHYIKQLKDVETEINTLSKQNNGKNGTRILHPELPQVAT